MMKNRLYIYILGITLLFSGSGCSKFLEESSQDELRPGSAEDLQQLLIGEVYPLNDWILSYLDLMTDDVTSYFTNDNAKLPKLLNGEPAFTWQPDMFEQLLERSVAYTDSYEHYYRKIKGCNVILDYVDKVSGAESVKDNVKGQALAMRSYFYFMLVNLFAQPYNAADVDIETAPGVPLLLVSKVSDEPPARASIARVYQQIENDLLTAGPLLDKFGRDNSKLKATDLFVYTLLSRMYLYMEKWDKSVEYANKVLERNSQLLKLSNLPIPTRITAATKNVFDIAGPETIWMYSNYQEFNQFFVAPGYGDRPMYCVSQSLENSYEHDWSETSTNRKDLRPAFFYRRYYISATTYDVRMMDGAKYSGAPYCTKGMRVSESYLNRAEGYIQQYLKNGDESLRIAALIDLNYLREQRYDTRNVAYQPVDILNGQELLKFCRSERRRELSFEEHRWFDLRRYGMPEIRHTFQGVANQVPVEYILSQGNKRYVLPIPQSVLIKNPNLVPNP